jgi:hypothetical protein
MFGVEYEEAGFHMAKTGIFMGLWMASLCAVVNMYNKNFQFYLPFFFIHCMSIRLFYHLVNIE